ncbi:MAG: hypothetical protein PF481_11545 [Bacteroidales bacterium]|jgi:cell division protein FtsQ|nr:hypothetical protein [Bacteroidales bacterium]
MKQIQTYIISGIIVIIAVTGLSFSESTRNSMLCTEIAINIDNNTDSNNFIRHQDVLQLIQPYTDSINSRKISSISLHKIEKTILNHPSVENCNVYITVHGKMCIDISQRTPLVRIESKHDSFYIDKKGRLMPLSKNYTSHSIIATGNINAGYREKYNILIPNQDTTLHNLYTIAQFITNNELLESIIEQIHITEGNEYILVSKVGPTYIHIGSPEHLTYKLRNLEAFYHSKKARELWNTYRTINLKYKNQIICTKK